MEKVTNKKYTKAERKKIILQRIEERNADIRMAAFNKLYEKQK